MLAQARPKSNAVVRSRNDVEQIELDSNVFDAAMCSLAIHQFPDLTRAFRELARALKPACPTSTRSEGQV
jgi:ubiquinone/menaquinone biosynthesis C-methylase UbiE